MVFIVVKMLKYQQKKAKHSLLGNINIAYIYGGDYLVFQIVAIMVTMQLPIKPILDARNTVNTGLKDNLSISKQAINYFFV